MNFTIQQAADACNGELCRAEGKINLNLQGAVLDSRKIEPGYLFFAVKGEKTDGHAFIQQAAEAGAVCVVCEKEPEIEIPYIKVKDSLKALKEIAEEYRKNLNITVVGITGSVGKTSAKEFIAQVLSEKYRVHYTEGNYNNEIGLPLTILKIQEEHEVAVLEMGISEFGEMHRLSKMAQPDICVITNIGQCHLENLKSREGILKAKSEIFDYMSEFGYIVLNGDDDMLFRMNEVNGIRPIYYGLCQENCDLYATDIVNKGLLGTEAILHLEDYKVPVKIPLPGQHMIYNALSAVAVGRILDLAFDEIQSGLQKIEAVGGRSHVVQTEKYTIIDDCYNANPISVKAAIDLITTVSGRKVAILGDMFELGKDEKELHAEIGQYAMENKVDLLLCVGQLSKYMYDEALRVRNEEQNVQYFESREELLNELKIILKKEDTILVKASHGMHFEEVVLRLEE